MGIVNAFDLSRDSLWSAKLTVVLTGANVSPILCNTHPGLLTVDASVAPRIKVMYQ